MWKIVYFAIWSSVKTFTFSNLERENFFFNNIKNRSMTTSVTKSRHLGRHYRSSMDLYTVNLVSKFWIFNSKLLTQKNSPFTFSIAQTKHIYPQILSRFILMGTFPIAMMLQNCEGLKSCGPQFGHCAVADLAQLETHLLMAASAAQIYSRQGNWIFSFHLE